MTIEPIQPAAVESRLAAGLPQWRLRDGALEREFRTGAWQRTLLLANAIGFAAEAAGHHPDLLLSYPAIRVRLSTHDAGGITEKDFALAQRIEAIASWRPGDDSPLDGPPADWF